MVVFDEKILQLPSQHNHDNIEHLEIIYVVWRLCVAFLIKVYIHSCFPVMIGIWKTQRSNPKFSKQKVWWKTHHIYETYKKQSCHMYVIFIPKHLIWHKLQCAYILILIIHFHTWNVYLGAVTIVHVSIFLTKKHIIRIQTQHPQYGFTFIT